MRYLVFILLLWAACTEPSITTQGTDIRLPSSGGSVSGDWELIAINPYYRDSDGIPVGHVTTINSFNGISSNNNEAYDTSQLLNLGIQQTVFLPQVATEYDSVRVVGSLVIENIDSAGNAQIVLFQASSSDVGYNSNSSVDFTDIGMQTIAGSGTSNSQRILNIDFKTGTNLSTGDRLHVGLIHEGFQTVASQGDFRLSWSIYGKR